MGLVVAASHPGLMALLPFPQVLERPESADPDNSIGSLAGQSRQPQL
jgi:hypothetical protein